MGPGSNDFENILFRVHNRGSRACAGVLTYPLRKLVELLLLLSAVSTFGVFVWLHREHVW